MRNMFFSERIMIETKNDRRTAKTRKAINTAFILLLTQKELNKITVQDISDNADINRSTFYKHYLDVYDLYDKVEHDILVDWSSLILRLEELGTRDCLSSLIEHVDANRDVFTLVFSPNTPGKLRVALYKIMEGLFRKMASERLNTDIKNDRLSYQTRYRAEGCMALLCKWVTEGFKQPKEFMIQLICELDMNTESLISE